MFISLFVETWILKYTNDQSRQGAHHMAVVLHYAFLASHVNCS